MAELNVRDGWIVEVGGTKEILDWMKENEIADEDWNFSTTGIVGCPKFIFVHDEDAIAFKLRFGL